MKKIICALLFVAPAMLFCASKNPLKGMFEKTEAQKFKDLYFNEKGVKGLEIRPLLPGEAERKKSNKITYSEQFQCFVAGGQVEEIAMGPENVAALLEFNSNFKHLERINFSGAQLKLIGKNDFSGCRELPFLKTLNLSNNKIEAVESGAFDHLVSVETITLNDNKITNLPEDLFKNNKELQGVLLNENNIKDLGDSLKGLRQGCIVVVTDNPLKVSALDKVDPKNRKSIHGFEWDKKTIFECLGARALDWWNK